MCRTDGAILPSGVIRRRTRQAPAWTACPRESVFSRRSVQEYVCSCVVGSRLDSVPARERIFPPKRPVASEDQTAVDLMLGDVELVFEELGYPFLLGVVQSVDRRLTISLDQLIVDDVAYGSIIHF